MNNDHGRDKSREDLLRDLAESNRRVGEMEKAEEEHARAHEQILKLNAVKEGLIGPGSPDEKLLRVTEALVEILNVSLARIWIVGEADLCAKGCPRTTHGENSGPCRARARCLHLVADSGSGAAHVDSSQLRIPADSDEIRHIVSGTDFGPTSDATNTFSFSDHISNGTRGLTSYAANRLFSRSGAAVGIVAVFGSRAMTSLELSLFKDFAAFTSLLVQS